MHISICIGRLQPDSTLSGLSELCFPQVVMAHTEIHPDASTYTLLYYSVCLCLSCFLSVSRRVCVCVFERERERQRQRQRQTETEKWLTASSPIQFDTISHHPPPVPLNTPSSSLPLPVYLNLPSHLPYPCLCQDQAAND